MNIPTKIIEKLNLIPDTLKAEVCYILIEYMNTGSYEGLNVSVDAKMAFTDIQSELDVILARRRKAREYRQRRKAMLEAKKESEMKARKDEQAVAEVEISQREPKTPATGVFFTPPLSRRERRRLERLKNKPRMKNRPLQPRR